MNGLTRLKCRMRARAVEIRLVGRVMDGLVSHSVGDRDVIQIRKQSAAIGWEKQDEELSWGSHTRRNRLKRKGNKEAKSTELNLATDRWVAGTGEVRE